MEWKNVLIVGIEVVLALGTGIAVFAGINSACNKTTEPNNPSTNGCADNYSDATGEQLAERVPSSNNNLVTGLRATQETCAKVLNVVGALATAVESIAMIFGHGQNYNMSYNPYGQPASFYSSAPMYGNDGNPQMYRLNRYVQVCY